MEVKIVFKSGKTEKYNETAVFDDKEAGRIVFMWGKVSGGRLNGGLGNGVSPYRIDEISHIAINRSDIDHIEVRA